MSTSNLDAVFLAQRLPLLRTLLPTVLAHSPQVEVIVADNASTDGSLPLLQQTFP